MNEPRITHASRSRILGVATCLLLAAARADLTSAGEPPDKSFLARDQRLELATPYLPPPGNPLEHHAAGFAQIMCSAVFITGLDPAFAAENVGYFTAPYAERAKLGKPTIDEGAKTVSVAVPGGITRVASPVRRSSPGRWATSLSGNYCRTARR